MALSGIQPFIKVIDSNGLPIVGAKLYVYDAGTTNLKSIYSDSGLSVSLSNPLTGANASNASGDFPRFYLAAGTYKLRAETSAGALIWQYDDIDTATSAGSGALPIAGGGTGATTAAAARANLDVPATSELTAISTQIATFSASLNSLLASPGGRLTLTTLTPVLTTGVTAGTAVYYTPYLTNLCPIYDGVQFNLSSFDELTLTLASQHTASNIFDCFIINDNGTIRIVTGPAWTTATAGAGSRGTGAGTTELTRLNGILVNANAMATARNGATTYSVAANQGTYVGSLFIDGTNGQITCHTAYGQSRKWGVWNMYNRVPVILQAGDSTASWTYSSATFRAANGSSANSLTIFSGLTEEWYALKALSLVNGTTNAGASIGGKVAIGYNSTTAQSGFFSYPQIGATAASFAFTNPAVAEYSANPALGINVITIQEACSTANSVTFFGTENGNLLTAQWRA